MKVKEAIKLLQTMDQEVDVYLDFGLYIPLTKYTPPTYQPSWVPPSYVKFNEITCKAYIH